MFPFPITQVVNGHKITYLQDNEGLVYPTRDLIMPSGDVWKISAEELQDVLPTYVDDTIGFYVEMCELTDCTDKELMDLIGDCT